MSISTFSKGGEHDSPGVVIIPPMVFYMCLLLGGAFEFFAPSDLPVIPKLIRIILGLVIGCSGFAFMMMAHEQFKRVKTNVRTNLPAKTLVVQRAYPISRNPMYVGISAFFLGIGLAVGSVWMLTAYIPLGLYLSLYVIPLEEAYMERTFGEDYKVYCRNVRRWL